MLRCRSYLGFIIQMANMTKTALHPSDVIVIGFSLPTLCVVLCYVFLMFWDALCVCVYYVMSHYATSR